MLVFIAFDSAPPRELHFGGRNSWGRAGLLSLDRFYNTLFCSSGIDPEFSGYRSAPV